VRTVYDPVADVFRKFSLGVRITNCVRTTAWYELAGSVALSRMLGPVADGMTARHPGTVLLSEPGYRTVAAASKRCYEGLAVIVRDGIRARLAPGVTPLLAAPRLRALLAGAPLPGKANLRVRWARSADRQAGFVPVPSPWRQR
jgi:siderophore synthetase component